MNDTFRDVVCDKFVMDLHNLAKDEATVKFMVTKDKNQICYLDFVSNTLKNHGCKSYNWSS